MRRLFTLSTTLFVCTVLSVAPVSFAQDEGNTAADEQAPNLTLSEQQEQAPNTPLINGNGLLMNFSDAPLQTVLEYLSEQAGLIVVNDTTVDGRITVVNRQPITIDEAINLINTLLMEKGYTAVRRDRLLRIVRLQDAKLDAIPVRYGNDPDQIGNTDTIITQIVPIRYADAKSLADDLSPLIDTEIAEVAANEASNSLIITDAEANIKRIVQIVNAVDKSISSVTQVRVFQLQYADAEDTAQLLEETFEDRESADSAVGRAIQRRFSRFGPPGMGGNDDSNTQVQGREVSAASDERTNSVVVSASPELMTVVEEVINQLDADTTARESVLVYHVKHILATDLETAFNDLFDENSSSSSNNSPRDPRSRNNNNSSSSSDSFAGSLVGQVTTVADEATNTLMILTPERNHDRIMAILESLDTQQPQVLIRVLIAEVSIDDQLDVGVEGELYNVGGSVDSLLTDFSVAAASGGFQAVLLDTDDFLLNIRLLQEVGKLEVVSRPYILASDNQPSNILIGEEFPFVTNTRETDAGNTINTIEYREIGLILDVTPQINPDNRVTLDVSQELSTISGRTVAISEQLDAQVIAKRFAETRVAIQGGQTIVIGGLMEDQYTLTESKVPLLGDIPGLGALFRRKQETKSKTELLLFLTPEIVTDVGTLEKIGEGIYKSTEIVENAVEPGTLEKHLFNMKTRYENESTDEQVNESEE